MGATGYLWVYIREFSHI